MREGGELKGEGRETNKERERERERERVRKREREGAYYKQSWWGAFQVNRGLEH